MPNKNFKAPSKSLTSQFKGAPGPASFSKKLGNVSVTPITQ